MIAREMATATSGMTRRRGRRATAFVAS